MQQLHDVPLLLIAGAPGSGKSSVAWEIFFTLIRSGVPVANLDLDVVGYGPPPSFGSFEMKVRNLGSIWRNYQAAGARGCVVSGIGAAADEIEACARAVPGSVPTVCVLTVTEAEQRARIFRPGAPGVRLEPRRRIQRPDTGSAGKIRRRCRTGIGCV